MGAAIRFRSVIALLGAFPVLAGVDLDVARGEVVLLEGANGAGKTSLLRACAGLLQVVSGEADVLGCDLLEGPRIARPPRAVAGDTGRAAVSGPTPPHRARRTRRPRPRAVAARRTPRRTR